MRIACLVLSGLLVVVAAACSDEAAPASRVLPTATPGAAAALGTPPADGVVTIAAIGDVMLARDLVSLMERNGPFYPFERVAHLWDDADLTVANLEGTFTERGVAADKLYTFRTPPRFAIGLARAGIDVVSLGNNHAGDFGPVGIEDTVAALDGAGVLHAGAGPDEASARRPAVARAEGLRIAFLSYSEVADSAFAGPAASGVARATAGTIAADVASARARADAVVVLLHSGVEYTDAPQPEQQRLARAAVDAGALLVLGHHAHTLQGWERYGQGLIAYGLGNFVFDLDREDLANLGRRAFETAVVFVTLSADEVLDVRIEPVFIDPDENRPRPATPDEAGAIVARLQALNELAGGP